MAFSLRLRNLDLKTKDQIAKSLTVRTKKTTFNPTPKDLFLFSTNSGRIYLPLGQWEKYCDSFPHPASHYPRTRVKFTRKLYTLETDPKKKRDQDVVAREAVQRLKERHTVFISCHTGYGKTALAIYLIAKFKYKTAVLCHFREVNNQLPDEIKKFTGDTCKVQFVKGKTPLDPEADVYFFGIQKAKSLRRKDLAHIGMVIIDEAHVCTMTAFTHSLLRFQPQYLVGLSATPDRDDGLHKVFYSYFSPLKEFIYREEVKPFRVVKYKTKYVPIKEPAMVYGKMITDWKEVERSIAENVERQGEIAQIIQRHPEHKIIVLCKRCACRDGIASFLDEDEVEILKGSKKRTGTKRITITTLQKGGVGLNDPDLTMLVLEADPKDVRQYEGRLRTENCLIYDIVDDYDVDNPRRDVFENHWKGREEWYLRRGAEIVHEGVPPKTKKPRTGKGIRKRYTPKNTATTESV